MEWHRYVAFFTLFAAVIGMLGTFAWFFFHVAVFIFSGGTNV